nr:MAG TPA: hypothetical protein [Caudoviricetes sp.]
MQLTRSSDKYDTILMLENVSMQLRRIHLYDRLFKNDAF